ncbi:MAG: GNAT family N-acetyltransferase [Proteobacteria bacterium]|nr:GNAT family N-acetyltransferase [Pseudomonadota bacterium]MBU1738894.1 GNAT family N-acetyltransferase [Pseudomonadota bacterium]
MDLTIRKATQDDAVFLAQTIMMAGRQHVGRGIVEHILGCKEAECQTFLSLLPITQKPHLLHHSSFTIAEIGGKAVGCLSGYDPKKLGYQALHDAMPEVIAILGWSDAEHEVAKARTAKFLPCLPEQTDGAWMIDRGGILPDQRRKGAMTRLIETVLDEGRSQGYKQAQVNIFIGNEPALKLHEKLGFSVKEEKADEFFEKMIGAPGIISMVKDL